MTDPLSTSKAARESLSRGLNALQADPSVPPALVELAAPIAQAMGALHQIERTQQLTPHADLALTNIRGALAQLQAAPSNHPAVASALDAVATALSLVHQLSRAANGPQGGNTAQPPGPLSPPPQQPPPHAASPRPTTEAIPQKAPPQASGSQPQMAPHAFPPPPPQNFTAPQPQRPSLQQPPPHQQPAYQPPPPQPAYAPPNQPSQPMVARDPFAAPSNPAFAGPPPQPPMASGPQVMAPASPSIPVPAPPAQGGAQLVSADLGAHSPTNFFKGLSGNDIIDHGGIFVSTYALPKIGHPVRIKVSLPGGYEFEANAVVKWTREEGGEDVPPGFGAKFTGITPEARQLVYRYVRNREPMFYDDL